MGALIVLYLSVCVPQYVTEIILSVSMESLNSVKDETGFSRPCQLLSLCTVSSELLINPEDINGK